MAATLFNNAGHTEVKFETNKLKIIRNSVVWWFEGKWYDLKDFIRYMRAYRK